MRIPPGFELDPAGEALLDRIGELPTAQGIYVLAVPGKAPHLSWSVNLRRRLGRLLSPKNGSSDGLLGRLRKSLALIQYWPTGSRLESSLLMYGLAKSFFPDDYMKRLRLRTPWFIGLSHNDPFPRFAVVNRIHRESGPLFGPFLSRDLAQRYQEEVLGLFQIRRCTETLHPHPEHPGCIYGEMNQCLRPCQCAVTGEEYAAEVHRTAEFLATNGKSALSVLSAARDRASELTDFEEAALIHKRIEHVQRAAGARDEAVREIHQFNGVAVTRGIENASFRLWPMLDGYWQEPVHLTFSLNDSRAKSMDGEIRERLGEAARHNEASGSRLEHLAIFSRWYYSSWRDGQWFPFCSIADLNYRRLVHEISKLAKAERGPQGR